MKTEKTHVCPVGLAGGLDNRIRRCIHNPAKILAPYVKEGMTVLEVGPGPGFFSLYIAHMVGAGGRLIAADLQPGMLKKLEAKLEGSELAGRVTLHTCEPERIGVTDPVDFVLLFYMVHEVPNPSAFFSEIASILKPDGKILLVEPPFHVSKKAFETTLTIARDSCLAILSHPKTFLDQIAVLGKG